MIFRLEGVTKAYAGHTALRSVSVAVEPGSIGLLGPNGAGKSTLIKVLLGLVQLTEGRAEVLGLDTRSEPVRIREQVGYMPEDDCYLAGLSGVEMVARAGELAGIPPRTALRRAHEMLDYVRLDDARYREVQTYSTGMKQRVKLATALVHSPRMVFLDEPTSGMDPEGREQMLALVKSLATEKGVSVVISTHILHDVEVCCDSVLMLGRGELLVYEKLDVLQQTVENSASARIGGDPERVVAALQRRGLRARASGAESIELEGECDLAPALLEALTECGSSLREYTPARNSLEQIFLEQLRGEHADS